MVCYHEGQPSECSTEQEMAEFVAFMAASEAEVDGYEADYYQSEAELNQYCSQNPWACQEPESTLASISGPSACDDLDSPFGSCSSEATQATVSFGAHVVVIAGAEGALADAAAAGVRLSKATRFSWAGAIATTAFAAGYYVGSFANCVFNFLKAPDAELLSFGASGEVKPRTATRHYFDVEGPWNDMMAAGSQ